MPTQEEIINQLSELVAKLRAENTMSSDAGSFQTPPPSGDCPDINDASQNNNPQIARVIRQRLRSIKKNPSTD